jgi:plasmid maintenance system antidote protein VapI
MSRYKYDPDYAVPPGATLKETLKEEHMSQADFAIRMGMSEKTVSLLINGKAPLSIKTSLKLELVLGIPARFWNLRELNYRQALRSSASSPSVGEHP